MCALAKNNRGIIPLVSDESPDFSQIWGLPANATISPPSGFHKDTTLWIKKLVLMSAQGSGLKAFQYYLPSDEAGQETIDSCVWSDLTDDASEGDRFCASQVR